MRSARLMALLMLTPVLTFSSRGVADIVQRRGGQEVVRGSVTAVNDAGVTIRTEPGATQIIAWDRVRGVETDRLVPDLPQRLAAATDLWRARSRVERGDHGLAEPLLERLFERTRGATHETALVVAEGLLRCRLARGANADAVIAALEVARLRGGGVTTDSYAELPPVLDTPTRLCPRLAPAWVQSREIDKLQRDLKAYDAHGDAVIAAIADVYRRAALQHLAAPEVPGAATLPEKVRDAGGVRLIRACVDAGSADAQVRDEARRWLRERLADAPSWSEGWIRFAVGTSLLHESAAPARQRGLVELVHLPVRFHTRLPYLAGLATAWIAADSRATGDTATLAIMEQELLRRFPNHPVRTATDPVRLPPVETSTP